MPRKGQELSKDLLKQMGFVSITYDPQTDSYTIIRDYWNNHHCNGKVRRELTISPYTQYHPYGDDFKSYRASFRYNKKNYSISFPRLLWAWENGYIKDTDIVKYNKDATTHTINDYHIQDYKDHDGWKYENQYTRIAQRVKEFIRQIENGEEPTALKW